MGGRVSPNRLSRSAAWVLPLSILGSLTSSTILSAQQVPGSGSGQIRRIPEHAPINTAAVQGTIRDQGGRAVPGAQVEFRNASGVSTAWSNAEGIFRLRDLRLGSYEVRVSRDGFETLSIADQPVSAVGISVLDL